jgi:hypothetical protein
VEYRRVSNEKAQQKLLEVAAQNKNLQLEDAKRQVEIDRILADGQQVLAEKSQLGIAIKSWNGVLPSTIVLGPELLSSWTPAAHSANVSASTARTPGVKQQNNQSGSK